MLFGKAVIAAMNNDGWQYG